MVLKKSFWMLFKSFVLLFILFLSLNKSLFFKLSFIDNPLSKINQFIFSLNLDPISILFLCMVFLVTSLVVLYSEFYMEFYNNKKFFYLTISFLLFMLVLSTSGSIMNFMIGWDGLGISSLCLIMFYSNKNTMYNSFLTFFFNRLGDLILMFIFCFFICSPSYFFFLTSNFSWFLLLLFSLCSFTKSAQFPLSSWLPAAMSAPTPISAMVHSSTLVTAGILLIMKIIEFLSFYNLNLILLLFSLSTFCLGGVLANLEIDLKKMVAFSTMSQISMIIFFVSLGLIFIGMAHTFLHAMFKTLLFCSCGLIFTVNFSSQMSKTFLVGESSKSMIFFLFVSIFSMSGMIFSSSFFTKDLVLELTLNENFSSFFFLAIFGGFCTILYSGSILESYCNSCNIFSSFVGISKNYMFFFIFLFSILTLFWNNFLIELTPLSSVAMASSSQIIFLCMLIMMPAMLSNEFLKKNFSSLSYEIGFSKFFSFTAVSKLMNDHFSSVMISDQVFVKPYLLNLNLSMFVFKWGGPNLYSFIFMTMMFLSF